MRRFDRSPKLVGDLVKEGAEGASSLADLVASSSGRELSG